MKTLYAQFDDQLYFELGWEMDILAYWPKDTSSILEQYLNQTKAQIKSTTVDPDGRRTFLNLHGPFYQLPSKNNYRKVTPTEFKGLISHSVDKWSDVSDMLETIQQREVFKKEIIEQSIVADKMKGSEIFFLLWSYDVGGTPAQLDWFKFYHYNEFIFVNLDTRKIYKGLLAAE